MAVADIRLDVELTAVRGGALRAAAVVLVSTLIAVLVPGVAGDGPPTAAVGDDHAVAAPQAPVVPPAGGPQAPTVLPGSSPRADLVAGAADGIGGDAVGLGLGPGAGTVVVPPIPPTPVEPSTPVVDGDGDGSAPPDVADPDACGLPDGVRLFGRPPSCDELAGWEVCLLPNGIVVFSPIRCWELEAPGVPCAVNDLVAYGAADCFDLDFSVAAGMWTGPWQRDDDGSWTSTLTPSTSTDHRGATTSTRSVAAFDGRADDRSARLTPTGWSPDPGVASWTAVATFTGPGFRWRGPVTWWTGPARAGGASTWRWTAPASWAAAPTDGGRATYAYVHTDAGVWEVDGRSGDGTDVTCELRVGWIVPGDCEALGIPACAVVGATGRCDGWLASDAADGVLGIDNPSAAAASAAGAVAAGGAPTGDTGASTDVDPGTAAAARAAGLGRATAAVDDAVEIAVAASATASADGVVVGADVDETLRVDPRTSAVLVELYTEVAALALLGDEVVTVSSQVVVQRVGEEVLLTVGTTVTVGRDGTPVQIVDQRSFAATDATTSLAVDGPLLPADLLTDAPADGALTGDTTWAAIRDVVGDHLAQVRAVVDGGPIGVGASRDGFRTLDESGIGVPLDSGTRRNEAEAEVELATDADSNATGAAAAAAAGSVAGANADVDGSTTTTQSLATATEALVEHDGTTTGESSSTGGTIEELYAGLDEVEAVDPAAAGTGPAAGTASAEGTATAAGGAHGETDSRAGCDSATDLAAPADSSTTQPAEPGDGQTTDDGATAGATADDGATAGATADDGATAGATADDGSTSACDVTLATASAQPPADRSTDEAVVDTAPAGSTEPEEDPLRGALPSPDDDGDDPTPPPEPPSDDVTAPVTDPSPEDPAP